MRVFLVNEELQEKEEHEDYIDDDESVSDFDAEKEEQILSDFLAGKFSNPFPHKRRHTVI